MARQGAQVTGTEVSSEALDRARRVAARYQVPIDFRQMAGESLEFPDETFDAVLCIRHTTTWIRSWRLARSLAFFALAEGLCSLSHWRPITRMGLSAVWSVGLREATTSHETPLRIRDLEILRRHFRQVDWRGMFLLTTSMIYSDRIWNDANPAVHRLTGLGFKWLLPMDERLMKISMLGKIAWKICVVVEK